MGEIQRSTAEARALSPSLLAAALAIFFFAVFFIPYFVSVTPVDSLSYVAGYSNRTGILLFAVGSILFGLMVRRYFPEAASADQPLGFRSLGAAIAIVSGCCAYRLLPIAQHNTGSEATYALNRIQMLASGHRPYLDFEFAYGPAHLYVPLLLAHLTHTSVVGGYYLWWIAQWLAGTAMLWAAIRLIDLPLPHRQVLFWLLFLIQLPALRDEGTAYTPTRSIGAAFFVVLVSVIWSRRRSPSLTAVAAVLCVALAFAISPEQGIAIFLGLLLWFILLTWQSRAVFSPGALATFFAGSAAVTLVCWRLGEFLTLIDFSNGAFSFPLLPSPTNIVILASYVAAACAAVQYFRARRFDSAVIPLFLCGFALLPSALGRCDTGHILSASPALFLGIATIESRPCLRRFWSHLAVALIVVPIISLTALLFRIQGSHNSIASQMPNPAVFAHSRGACPVIYRTVDVTPGPGETSAQDCLDTGHYYLFANALTSHSLQVMLGDLDRRPLHPLVFYDAPLAAQLGPIQTRLPLLHVFEFSPWVPEPRNPAFSHQELITYIQTNYSPASSPIAGFRIWYPKPASGVSTSAPTPSPHRQPASP